MHEILRFDRVAFQYPQQPRPLFGEVSFVLYEGDRVGILGYNGSGKTTLLKLMAGRLQPIDGQIVRHRTRIRTLDQVATLTTDPAFPILAVLLEPPELGQLYAELEAMESQGIPDPMGYAEKIQQFQDVGGFERLHAIQRALSRWKAPAAWVHRRWSELSGGERRLLLILRTLLQPADLYLLDEPTNFLDDEGLALLVRAVQNTPGTFVIVSHDRWFLDQTVQQIFELDRGRLIVYRGNYSVYFETKQRVWKERHRQAQRIDREIRHLRQIQHRYQIWGNRKEREKRGAYDKGFVGSRAARLMKRAARAREKIQQRIEELQRIKPFVEHPHPIRFPKVSVPKGICLSVFQVSQRMGDRLLFHGISFTVAWGEKVLIAGPNGSGKTTLLRILLGDLSPDSGEIHWDRGVRIGVLPQDLPPETDPTPLFKRYPIHIRTRALELLGCLGIRKETVYQPISHLSEGQRRKVRIVDLILQAPNVLILDEPTTHLDSPSIELLEQALCGWNGTLILVTHDRYLREALTLQTIPLGAQSTDRHRV